MRCRTLLEPDSLLLYCFKSGNYADAKVRTSGRKLTVTSANRKLEFKFNKSVKATVEKESTGTVVYISLMPTLKKAERTALSMALHASGVIDHSDAEIILDMQNPGSLFTGLEGISACRILLPTLK